MGLLLIRPQRATVVRKISLNEVKNARFIRLAVELEVATRACEKFNTSHITQFKTNLDKQYAAIKEGQLTGFSALDAEFHKLLCNTAEMPDVFSTIEEQKSKTDRLCALALHDEKECNEIYEDHKMLIQHLEDNDLDKLISRLRSHLSRLDATIEKISKSHEHYFE